LSDDVGGNQTNGEDESCHHKGKRYLFFHFSCFLRGLSSTRSGHHTTATGIGCKGTIKYHLTRQWSRIKSNLEFKFFSKNIEDYFNHPVKEKHQYTVIQELTCKTGNEHGHI